jgi:hypothetical protein
LNRLLDEAPEYLGPLVKGILSHSQLHTFQGHVEVVD